MLATVTITDEGFVFVDMGENVAEAQRIAESVGDIAGVMLRANNLADLVSAVTARSNLSVYSIAQTDAAIASAVTGLLEIKGSTNCSANPNYPAALKGDSYIVSVAGKIGGASGQSVDPLDWYIATADNAGGTQASVGTSWTVIEHNLAGVLLQSSNLSDVASKVAALDNLSVKGSDIASAATTDIAAATGGFVTVTGTTTITAFGTITAGTERTIHFSGALTLTHHATSLILPTGANITTSAGDVARMRSLGSGNWRCVGFMRADGTALVGGAITAKDEGSNLTTGMTSINFVGAGVTASNTGGAVDVTIPGGGGSGNSDIANHALCGGM